MDSHQDAGSAAPGREPSQPPLAERSVAELVRTATDQVSELVRLEMRLAQLEMAAKSKRFGFGGALLSAAGAFALVALMAGAATVAAALAVAVPVWAATLITSVLLLAVAGQLTLMGRKQLRRATPVRPEQAIAEARASAGHLAESMRP